MKLKEGDLLDFIPKDGSFPLRGEIMEGGFIHVQSDTGAELFNPDQHPDLPPLPANLQNLAPAHPRHSASVLNRPTSSSPSLRLASATIYNCDHLASPKSAPIAIPTIPSQGGTMQAVFDRPDRARVLPARSSIIDPLPRLRVPPARARLR